jgi:hypothetical protein
VVECRIAAIQSSKSRSHRFDSGSALTSIAFFGVFVSMAIEGRSLNDASCEIVTRCIPYTARRQVRLTCRRPRLCFPARVTTFCRPGLTKSSKFIYLARNQRVWKWVVRKGWRVSGIVVPTPQHHAGIATTGHGRVAADGGVCFAN